MKSFQGSQNAVKCRTDLFINRQIIHMPDLDAIIITQKNVIVKVMMISMYAISRHNVLHPPKKRKNNKEIEKESNRST